MADQVMFKPVTAKSSTFGVSLRFDLFCEELAYRRWRLSSVNPQAYRTRQGSVGLLR